MPSADAGRCRLWLRAAVSGAEEVMGREWCVHGVHDQKSLTVRVSHPL